MMYIPPFTISSKAINLIAEISALIDFKLQEILNTLRQHKGEPIEEVWDKVRDKFGLSSGQIIELILSNPSITLDVIAQKLQCSRRSVEKQVKKLREAGVLYRMGGNKNGYWEVKHED